MTDFICIDDPAKGKVLPRRHSGGARWTTYQGKPPGAEI